MNDKKKLKNLRRCFFCRVANMWQTHRRSVLVTTNLQFLADCNPLRQGLLQWKKREKQKRKTMIFYVFGGWCRFII